MRTSSQLTKVEQCEFHSKANITQTSDSQMRALAQKSVLKRMLRGEPITDIRGEIDNILSGMKCYWENAEQRASNLMLYEARIRRFLEYEMNVHQDQILFPDQIPQRTPEEKNEVVDFFGEPIEAKADYFIRDPEAHTTIVKKIKTSRYKKESEDLENYETYTLGLLGKKLFPNDTVFVEIDHLGDIDSKTERAAMNHPYMQEKKYSQIEFNESAINYFTARHDSEVTEPDQCTATDCAGCAMNGICHFEEPPIAEDMIQEVRPISEIRLTHAQQKVVEYEEGIARINAGAGAGKTLVVAMRIVELLKKGYDPEDICLLTFTNAGAGEMTARVVQYCAGNGIVLDPARLTSTTFNSFCYNLVKEHYDELGYACPPRVLPDETRSGIINRILDQYPRIEEWNYASSSAQPTFYQRGRTTLALPAAKIMFSEIKKEQYTRDNNPYLDDFSSVSLDLIFQMYDEFNETLMNRNFVEFDDQITQVFHLLQIHPSLFEELGYKHIIVDEFQDTDLPQINLLNAINDTSAFKSFMAVGDDSQAIFSFRHTSPEYMINFEQYFGRYDDFQLVENHRSAKDIIDIANQINALNENRVEKDLIATKPEGVGPDIHGFYSQLSEYRWVAEQIKEEIENGKQASDIAFLASTKNELTKMASILTEMGIPSILMNPIPYITNSRVSAIATLFEAFTEGTNRGLLDYQNALNHGALKGATAEEIEAIADSFGEEIRNTERTAAKFVEYAKALDPDEKDECYQSFIEKFSSYDNLDEIAEFFRDFKNYGQDSCFKREGKYDGVCLTTVHSAKGLEWDVTYLSLSKFDNEKLHKNSRQLTPRQLQEKEEANRKWFVGTTRAREKLVMTGEFVTKMTKDAVYLNDFVRKSYDLLGRPFPYTAMEYWETRDKEKQEIKESSRSKLPSLISKTENPMVLAPGSGKGAPTLSPMMTRDILADQRKYAEAVKAAKTKKAEHTPTVIKVRKRGIAKALANMQGYMEFCKKGSETAEIMRPKSTEGFKTNVFGKEITINPTLIVKDGNMVTVKQLRNETHPIGDADNNLDIAALGIIGKQYFPNSDIIVEIDEVGPFGTDNSRALKTTTISWDDITKAHYQQIASFTQETPERNEEEIEFA